MFNQIRNIAVVACLFLFISGGLSAQTPQELRLDSIVSGNLRAGGEQWYSVRASQAGFMTVETSGSTDTYLEVYNASRNLIASDDDGGEDNNAKLEIYAEAGTTYLFKLAGYDGEGGAYRIWAISTPVPPATELRLDSIVSGNIRAGEDYWYSVRIPQVGLVTVETSGSTDTYLEVYDSAYKLINGDDDGGEDSNAKLEIFAQAGITYLFKVKGYSRSEGGSYRIWAVSRPIPTAAELRFDSLVSGNIRAGEDYWYSVRPSQSGFVTAGTTGGTDTYLEAYDASYTLMASDDDGGGGSNAQVEIPVEAGKTYLFRLKGYSRSESGPYRIWASFERSGGAKG